MRERSLGGEADAAAGRRGRAWRSARSRTCTGCCAIAKYDERFVIPPAHAELAGHAVGPAGRLRPATSPAARAAAAPTAAPTGPRRRARRSTSAPRRRRPSRRPRRSWPRPRIGRVRRRGLRLRRRDGGAREPLRPHLAGAPVPRRRAAGGPRRRSRATADALPASPAPEHPAGFLAWWAAEPAAALARRYVETFDFSQRTRPAPDLLHPRRPPPARPGAAGPAPALPRGRAASWRAPSCPTTCR